jgi:hypothetical protein
MEANESTDKTRQAFLGLEERLNPAIDGIAAILPRAIRKFWITKLAAHE